MPITKQKWLQDLKNTNAELDAYRKIADGFEILARLPENQGTGKDSLYRTKAYHYNDLHKRCGEFLEKLESYDGEFTDGISTTPAEYPGTAESQEQT